MKDEIDKLTAECTEWKARAYFWQDKSEFYKLRNEKAIEYIKNNIYEYRHDIDIKDISITKKSTNFINELLNILNGDNE